LDGFELCLQCRRHPALAQVPVVLISKTYDAPADRTLARRVGASALVARTIDLVELIAAVRAAIEQDPATLPAPHRDHQRLDHTRAALAQLQRQVALNEELERRCAVQRAQLDMMSGVVEGLARRGDADQAIRAVLPAIVDISGISKGALYLLDATGAPT